MSWIENGEHAGAEDAWMAKLMRSAPQTDDTVFKKTNQETP
jgi:hypothetical protein